MVKPDAVVVYDQLHITYLRDWTLDVRRPVIILTGQVLNGGHLPKVGHAVPVEELHIPGRAALSGITATINIYSEADVIKLRVIANLKEE